MDSAVKQKTTELVRRVRAGDTEAYDELYRLTDRALAGFIRRRYGHLGDDFVQETAIRTHELALASLGDFEPGRASFLTWLCWLSHDVAHAVTRERYGPRYAPFNAAWFEEQAAPGRGPAGEYESSRRDRLLRDALARLPRQQRRVVELYDLEGLTFPATARRLRIPVGRVRRRRDLALATLRRRLGRRELEVVERDWTPVPTWTDWSDTGRDDDWTATVGAVVPDRPAGPGAAESEEATSR